MGLKRPIKASPYYTAHIANCQVSGYRGSRVTSISTTGKEKLLQLCGRTVADIRLALEKPKARRTLPGLNSMLKRGWNRVADGP